MVTIVKIDVFVGDGADKVLLHTNLPAATYPYEGNLIVRFEAAAGKGITFVREHFPKIQYKEIEL